MIGFQKVQILDSKLFNLVIIIQLIKKVITKVKIKEKRRI